MKLDFAVIGAQKAGSTFVADLLASRSDVFVPWDECPHLEDPDYADDGTEKLAKILHRAPAGATVGLKRPNYLGRPEVPRRFAHHFPTAKVVVVLRDPVRRFVSAYFHNVRYGFLPRDEPEVGMRRLLDGTYDNVPRSWEVLEFGMYGKLLSRWFEAVDPARVTVLVFEQVAEDTESARRQLSAHLDLDDAWPTDEPRVRMSAIKHPVRLAVWHRTNPYVYTYFDGGARLWMRRKMLAKAIHGFDEVVLSRLFPNDKVPDPSPELLHDIAARYTPDRSVLSQLLNRDFPEWATGY